MKTLKRILAVLLGVCTLAAFAACGTKDTSGTASEGAVSTESKEAGNGETVTVVDHNGNSVTVPVNPSRVVVCDIYPLPSVLAVFFDSAERIVGMAPPSMSAAKNSLLSELYPEILQASTGFIDGTAVNVEELMKLDPQIVFYSASDSALGEQLTASGFAAVGVSASNWGYDAIETLNEWFALLGQIFPDNDKTEIVSSYSDEVYNLVQERVKNLTDNEKKKVFFLFQYTESAIATSGKRFFGQWWADAVGALNASAELDADNAVQVNMEQIYAWDPELLFITNFNTASPEDIYNNAVGSADWSVISAVRNKQVYKMPLGMYRSYTCGVDTPVTLLWLAKAVYPSLFEDIDITAKTKEYYQKVFGIELTDAQAERIFTPLTEAGGGF